MPFRVLVTGDIHLGRTSTRLPRSVPAEAARAVNGWNAVVDHAISGRFDLLVLTGDVADQDNKFWEAIGPLEAGIHRLAEHDIRTLAVAGNHDHDVLPRLGGQLKESGAFGLLGRDGRWERHTIEADGRAVLHLDGWSFPASIVDFDPLEAYSPVPRDGVPVIGVVHGDLDATGSRYAPLSSGRLRQQPVDGWFLGHTHKPQVAVAGTPFVLYPGSPQALDFGEPGAHGAWRVEVEAGKLSSPELVPLSAIRYEELVVDVTGVESDADLERAVYSRLREAETRCHDESGGKLLALSLRLRLVGRSERFDRIDDSQQRLTEYSGSLPNVAVRVDGVRSEIRPALDLAALARGASPLATAARLLSALESTPDAPEVRELVGAAMSRLDAVSAGRDYVMLHEESWAEETRARAMLRDELTFIVGKLWHQQGGA